MTAGCLALTLGAAIGATAAAAVPQPGASPALRETATVQADRPADEPGRDRDPDLAEVRRLINVGQPREALDRLAALAPATGGGERQALVALLYGVAHYHADEPAKAIERLAPIVDRLQPDSIERREAGQILGLSLFVTGRTAEAIPHLEATRTWAGGNQQLAHTLGQAYIQTQRPDDARGVLADVFGVAPDSAAAHLVAAQVMVRLEQDPLAEAELRRALAKDPRLPGANALLGQIALFRGRLDEAVTLTRAELAISPVNASALSQLGDAYVRQGRWDAAEAALQKSIWLNPYYSAPYILLGRTYQKKQDHAAAEGMFRRAIQYDPNNRAAHYLLAQLLQQLGRDDEAAREFEIAERLRGGRTP